MRYLWDLPWLWWLRARKRPGQEALAIVGIAIGVALLFAVQIANTSVTGSVRELTEGITGSASLALVARDPHGIDAAHATAARSVEGVTAAAPALFVRANVSAADGGGEAAPVQLVGVDDRFASVAGQLVKGFGGQFGVKLRRALLMPRGLADRLGVDTGDRLRLAVGGRSHEVFVSTVVGAGQVGPLAQSAVVVAPLGYAQQLAGLPDRLTHVLIATADGREGAARAGLAAVADDRADVVASDHDARLIEQAAGPNEQSTGMFAAISMLVGVLFTFNAMLLTMPERRRFVAELRMQGFGRAQLATLVLFEALAIGVAGSLLGLLLGDLLSRHVFHAEPGYLAFAFPIGTQRIVSAEAVALAFAGGLAATLVASGRLLVDAIASVPLAAAYRSADEPGEGIPRRLRPWLAVAAGALVAFAVAIYLLAPALTVVGVGALGVAAVLLLPAAIDGALRLADRLADTGVGGLLSISVSELRANATRAVALAATGALAVFGSVAIEGAHRDLLRGLDDMQGSYIGTADVWVTAGGDENVLTTTPFAAPAALRALTASPLVASVRPYRGGFLDVAGHRAWVIARDAAGGDPIPAGQLVAGERARAAAALRDGGAVVLSDGLADHLGVDVGDELALPTPSGTERLRVAATTTNLGWAPGTLLLGGDDFRRAWASEDVSGVEVSLAPGVAPEQGRRLVESALPRDAALTVETAAERLDRFQRLSRAGLDRLSQISTLMLVAAALAMSAAMSAAIWQQRRRLAVLRMQGFDVEQVWATLVLQSLIVLSVGAGVGAAAGLAGQVLATRWVTLTTGFPSIFSPALALAGLTFAGVALVATLVVAIPGWFAARVSPTASFQGD
ncbi:FtsX-like permease family protein [Conexibacter arvalis]